MKVTSTGRKSPCCVFEADPPKPAEEKEQIATTHSLIAQMLLRLVGLPEQGTPRAPWAGVKIRIQVHRRIGQDWVGEIAGQLLCKLPYEARIDVAKREFIGSRRRPAETVWDRQRDQTPIRENGARTSTERRVESLATQNQLHFRAVILPNGLAPHRRRQPTGAGAGWASDRHRCAGQLAAIARGWH
jgi:hypothetical protein